MYTKIALIFLLLTGTALAQSDVLERYVDEGLHSNSALKSYRLQHARRITQLRQARGLFFPQVAFEASYTLAGGGRTIDIPIGDLLNPVYGTLNELMQSNAFPTVENASEQFLPNNFHDTRLSLQFPLFNSDIYFGYRARQALVSVADAQKAAYELELRHEIRLAYFRHLQAAEAVRIYENVRQVYAEVLRVNEKLVRNEKATPDVLATTQAEIARNAQDIADAAQQVIRSRAWFNFLLNRDLSSGIAIDSSLASWTPARIPVTAPVADVAQREELQALRYAIKAREASVDMKKYDALLPDMYIAGQAGFQGFGYTFDGNQDYWLAQVGLKWDLFGGRSKHYAREEAALDLSLARTELEKVRRQLELQVIDAWSGLQAADQQLCAASAARKSAAEATRMVRRRYEAGQAMLIELITARNALTTAEKGLLIAHYNTLIRAEELQKSIAQQ